MLVIKSMHKNQVESRVKNKRNILDHITFCSFPTKPNRNYTSWLSIKKKDILLINCYK